ncbi:MAG: PQQ-dependent sugar dehydrogenase [Pseudomonadota bacterium]
MRIAAFIAGLAVLLQTGTLAHAEERQVATGSVEVTRMVSGLDTPWAIGFLPDGGLLITERNGTLQLVQDGNARAVGGVPDVWARGQGGLLDLVVAKDFDRSREILFSFSEPTRAGAQTSVAIAELDVANARLSNVRVIFQQGDPTGGGRHFGSRIVEADDGSFFVTIGDRGDRDDAQDLGSYKGKLIRIDRDGSVPSDNPFVTGEAPAIFSYGHRNPQGAALAPDGQIWLVEHGARGGDEINRPEASKNYGWPVISYGREYTGGRIGSGTSAPGMEQPEFYWDPSIAPSGMMIYSGRLWPEWEGDIFIGSLKFDFISRLSISGGNVDEEERMFEGTYTRIRDVREAPDGSIWFLSEGDGAAYRVTPSGA